MLKLKLQYFSHLMQRIDSLEKTLMLGGIGGKRRRHLYFSRPEIKSPEIRSWFLFYILAFALHFKSTSDFFFIAATLISSVNVCLISIYFT